MKNLGAKFVFKLCVIMTIRNIVKNVVENTEENINPTISPPSDNY